MCEDGKKDTVGGSLAGHSDMCVCLKSRRVRPLASLSHHMVACDLHTLIFADASWLPRVQQRLSIELF